MKNSKKPELSQRRENYFVHATVIVEGQEIQKVPCKVYLPERTHEKPYLLFNPTKTDAVRMTGSYKVEFVAKVIGLDGELQATLTAPVVYLSENSTTHWGSDVSETIIIGEPQDLHIVDHLKGDGPPGEASVEFWVSPNEFLTPCISTELSYTGDIKQKRVRESEFVIKDGMRMKLDKRFVYKTLGNSDVVQWSHLVACVDIARPAIDLAAIKDSLLEDIDDFLVLVSFACRRRTACLGWSAYDKTAVIKFYRGNYSFPDVRKEFDSNDVVIDITHFEKFTSHTYQAFLAYENKLALRTALHSSIPSKPHLLESSFLSMFAGLETIILDFRRRANLEVVLPNKEWKALRNYIEACIKKFDDPPLEKGQRATMYSKLDELNRVSLREAFEIFCVNYEIDLSDLWPVFGAKGAVGLVNIRNKLIHGDPFPHDLFGTLIVAKEHLKYTLERILVRVLGWDVESTKVRPAFLSMYGLGIKNQQADQDKLAEYIFNQ